MNDAYDLAAAADDSIEYEVASLHEAARSGCDIGSGRAQAGMSREGGASLFQTIEQMVGRRRVVARDIEPDVQQIDLGLPRRANARQTFKLSRACV